MTKVNIQFIAEKDNVSASLVSKLLNNKEVRATEETKKKVFEIAKKYNYMPNRIAASLRTNKTNIIACILPHLYSDFFSELVYSIEVTANELGYETIICNARDEAELERKHIGLYKSGLIDGLIIDPSDNMSNIDMYRLYI